MRNLPVPVGRFQIRLTDIPLPPKETNFCCDEVTLPVSLWQAKLKKKKDGRARETEEEVEDNYCVSKKDGFFKKEKKIWVVSIENIM